MTATGEQIESIEILDDVHVPLADLAFSDLYATVMQGGTSARYVGLVAVAGSAPQHSLTISLSSGVQNASNGVNQP